MSEMSLEKQAAVSQKEMGKVEALPGYSMKKLQKLETEGCVQSGLGEYSDIGGMRGESGGVAQT